MAAGHERHGIYGRFRDTRTGRPPRLLHAKNTDSPAWKTEEANL